MSNKTFCPIMTIGFNPPKKGERDNRICMKDCAWYNHADQKCNINVIAEHLEVLEATTDSLTDMLSDAYEYTGVIPYDAFGIDENETDLNSRFGNQT